MDNPPSGKDYGTLTVFQNPTSLTLHPGVYTVTMSIKNEVSEDSISKNETISWGIFDIGSNLSYTGPGGEKMYGVGDDGNVYLIYYPLDAVHYTGRGISTFSKTFKLLRDILTFIQVIPRNGG